MRTLIAIAIASMLLGGVGLVSADRLEDAVVWDADALAVRIAGAQVVQDYGAFALVEGPASALARLGVAHDVEPVSPLIVKGSVRFDARDGDAALPPEVRALPGDDHLLVKFRGPIHADWRAWLDARATVLDYVPFDTMLVRSHVPASELAGFPMVRFVGSYHAAYKLHPAMPSDGPATVDVRVFEGESPDAVSDAAKDLGAEELLRSTAGPEAYLRFLLDAAKARQLAQHPSVAWLEPVFEGDPYDNDRAAWVTQSGRNPSSPDLPRGNSVHQKGLSGLHQVVAVADGGLDNNGTDFPHEMYADPTHGAYRFGEMNPLHRKVMAYFRLTEDGQVRGDYQGNTHGTHTAGSTSGDAPDAGAFGTWNKFDGQAPAAKLVVMDWSSLPFDYTNIFDPTYQAGARLHSNSYGYPHDNSYTVRARQNDLYAYKHPDFLIFRSVGNTGGNTLRPESVAKDVIGSGATNNGDAYNTLASFSSRGPTQDGRIKPTFTAPGNPVLSSVPGGGYGSLSGTSMSTPTSAGAAALVREYFLDGWYPGGAPDSGPRFNPSSALVKATLVNSARSMTSETSWPNGNQGWGVLRLDEALRFPGDPEGLFVSDGDTLGTGGVMDYTVQVTDASKGLKVTLAWTDPPASEGSNPALVNDLDLVVLSPVGVAFKGNALRDALGALGPESVPGTQADRRNTEEQAVFPSPTPGTWTIRVVGANVPFLAQPFAVVATGGI